MRRAWRHAWACRTWYCSTTLAALGMSYALGENGLLWALVPHVALLVALQWNDRADATPFITRSWPALRAVRQWGVVSTDRMGETIDARSRPVPPLQVNVTVTVDAFAAAMSEAEQVLLAKRLHRQITEEVQRDIQR